MNTTNNANFDCEGPLLHNIHIKRGPIMNVSNRPYGRTIYPYTYYQALYFDCKGPLLHFTQYSQITSTMMPVSNGPYNARIYPYGHEQDP